MTEMASRCFEKGQCTKLKRPNFPQKFTEITGFDVRIL